MNHAPETDAGDARRAETDDRSWAYEVLGGRPDPGEFPVLGFLFHAPPGSPCELMERLGETDDRLAAIEEADALLGCGGLCPAERVVVEDARRFLLRAASPEVVQASLDAFWSDPWWHAVRLFEALEAAHAVDLEFFLGELPRWRRERDLRASDVWGLALRLGRAPRFRRLMVDELVEEASEASVGLLQALLDEPETPLEEEPLALALAAARQRLEASSAAGIRSGTGPGPC